LTAGSAGSGPRTSNVTIGSTHLWPQNMGAPPEHSAELQPRGWAGRNERATQPCMRIEWSMTLRVVASPGKYVVRHRTRASGCERARPGLLLPAYRLRVGLNSVELWATQSVLVRSLARFTKRCDQRRRGRLRSGGNQ
jgi:hypothetical protein